VRRGRGEGGEVRGERSRRQNVFIRRGSSGDRWKEEEAARDSHVDLGSAATVSALAVDSIDGAVAGGAIAPSTTVSADAIAAVAEVSSGSARVLKQIAVDSGDTDPMAVVRSAASVTAVMQGPGVKGAISRRSRASVRIRKTARGSPP
jgi:hypothetical protein